VITQISRKKVDVGAELKTAVRTKNWAYISGLVPRYTRGEKVVVAATGIRLARVLTNVFKHLKVKREAQKSALAFC
jgi:hypothetical protein